jgi:RNA polymerase-interacting CarD/CdnL/TRCF family regulator
MSLKSGDRIVHQKFGVGVIGSIEEIDFNGTGMRPCHRVEFFKNTLWVDVDDPNDGGLRLLTPKNLLNRYRILLTSLPITFDHDYHKRRIELEKEFSQGTFQGLCEVVRDLHAFKNKSTLNTYDKAFYERTLDILVQEWSETSGITPYEAKHEIESILQGGKMRPVHA